MVQPKFCEGLSLFQCGFCPTDAHTYLGALCHEIETHVRQIICTGCADPLTQFLEHYQSLHDDQEGRRKGRTGLEDVKEEIAKTKSSVVLAMPVTAQTANLVTLSISSDRPSEQATLEPPPSAHDLRAKPTNSPVELCQTSLEDADPIACDTEENLVAETSVQPTSETEDVDLPIASFKTEASSADDGGHCTDSSANSWDVFDQGVEKIFRKLTFFNRGRNLSAEKVASVMGEIAACERLLTPPEEPSASVNFSALKLSDAEREQLSRAEQAAALAAKFVKAFHGNLAVRGRLHDRNGPRGQKLLCEDCALPFGTFSALLAHKEVVHGVQKQFKCLRCGNKHNNRSAIIRHAAWARFGKSLRCRRQNCFEMFASGEERRIHTVEKHGKLKCPQCDEEFVAYCVLERHKLFSHSTTVAVGTYTCVICKKQDFVNKVQYVMHEKYCRYTFNDLSRVPGTSKEPSAFAGRPPRIPRLEPAKKSQEKDLLFRCSVCGHMCGSESGKQFHEDSCHTVEGGKPVHNCPFCANAFEDVQSFRIHLRTHSSTVRYQCHLCPKTFASYPGRSFHIQKEHTKKRYQCPRCELTFKTHSQLRDHEGEHEGKPRHKCLVCGATFYKSPTFQDHRRRCKPGAVARVKGSKLS